MAQVKPRGRMARLCTDFLMLGVQVVTGHAQLPDHDSLRQRLRASFEELSQKAKAAGLTAADVDDTRYAIAAFLDEMVQFSNWPGKQQWAIQPLQVELFAEQLAGIKFFERLQAVGARSPEVLEVYYLCMTLGFCGQYRLGDMRELQQLIEAVRQRLVPKWSGRLSAHGVAETAGGGGKRFPLGPLAVGFVVIALVVAGLLMILIKGGESDAIKLLSNLARGG